MNKITAFVRLDFYTLKPYTKSFLLMLVMSVVMGISFKSTTMLNYYFMMCIILSLTYPFSIGELNKLDTLYATLSLNRRKIVAGRYIFAICMGLIAIMSSLVFAFSLSSFGIMDFVASEMMLNLCITSTVFLTMLSIQYPIYFKLGYNKAKFIAYVPFLVIFIGGIIAGNLLQKMNVDVKDFENFIESFASSKVASLALPIVGSMLVLLSYKVSCRFYEDRVI